MTRVIALLVLCVTLSACALVDLAAHGVKEYESSRGQGGPPPEDEAQPRPQAASQASDPRILPADAGAEPSQTMPPRESVEVESLK